MFYGSEHSDLKPANGEYAFVGSLYGLYRLLLGCWRRETCAPRMQEKWSESNPTCGQCSITAFLVQDIFGGEVYGVPLGDGNYHCFNVVGNAVFDLTSEQFDHPLEYTLNFPQKRETHFAKAEKKQRYDLLKLALLQQSLEVKYCREGCFEGMNMQFRDKVVVVTGGAQGIGKCIAECFRHEGSTVYIIDKQDGPWFVGDLADKATLERFSADVIAKSGKVDVVINNAMPLFKGIDECTYEEFAYAQAVGVVAPFYLAKLFKGNFAKGASIVNISSSRDRMSQPQTESYTAAKGGIAALTHALAASLAGRVRVNSISPGWIDTTGKTYAGPDASQHFSGRVGIPMDIANMVLYLASDKAGFITGENICIDGGMTRNMIYHNDFGWRFTK